MKPSKRNLQRPDKKATKKDGPPPPSKYALKLARERRLAMERDE